MLDSYRIQADARGVPVSACKAQSLEDYEIALRQFQSYFGDPTETLAATLERDPEFVMGHVFVASALLTVSERQYLPIMREHVEKAEALAGKANEREKMLTAAARHGVEGRWDEACVMWDRVLADYPRDALAIQCAHLVDFLTGDALNLRDRVGRVIGRWDESVPGYSFILGMQAFGFEECNQYDRAEAAGRTALEIEPRDPWSVHAVTHVLEMQNRHDEGREFMRGRVDDWAPDNGFAFHNWWHLALFHVEQEDFAGALRLYDEQILPGDSDMSMQMLDATALLWRLELQGVDVGERWHKIAELWARKTPLENGYYAFNDFHAIVSLLGAGRVAEAREVFADLKRAARENPPFTRMMARDVGVPVCAAAIAFAEERYADAVDNLLPIRSVAPRFGGSHAQRDILTQTLIEAAIRAGQKGLATNLIGERLVHKPNSPIVRRFASRIPA